MVKFSYDGINNIKEMINTNELKELGKLTKTSFTRERKMGFTKLINYILNKKGLSTNMEINNFYNKICIDNYSYAKKHFNIKDVSKNFKNNLFNI